MNKYSASYLALTEYGYEHKHLIHVTTITTTFKIDTDYIDIDYIYQKFNITDVTIKKSNFEKQFKNQITLNFSLFSNKKSLKVFKNGNVQVTGASSYFESEYITELLIEWLNITFSELNISFKVMSGSLNIVMINININTFRKFRLKHLHAALNNKQDDRNKRIIRCSYHPDNYPALNIKFKSGTSMFVFHTGNIIVSNSTLQKIHTDYMSICHIINTDLKDVEYKYNKQSKNSIKIVHGYDMKDLLSCIRI
jgi:TATA-box binding protein (TBP) (component of TFIID and TFIIIB)